MEPEEVADLLGACSSSGGGGSGGQPPPLGGSHAASPASYAAIISAMTARASELEISLSFPDDEPRRPGAGQVLATEPAGAISPGESRNQQGRTHGGDEKASPATPATSATVAAAALRTGGDGVSSSTDAWRDEALRFIVEAAEAEAEHAEAALQAAVPAMHEWWIQVMSASAGREGGMG